jgi:hypothetical protein
MRSVDPAYVMVVFSYPCYLTWTIIDAEYSACIVLVHGHVAHVPLIHARHVWGFVPTWNILMHMGTSCEVEHIESECGSVCLPNSSRVRNLIEKKKKKKIP